MKQVGFPGHQAPEQWVTFLVEFNKRVETKMDCQRVRERVMENCDRIRGTCFDRDWTRSRYSKSATQEDDAY